MNGFTRKFAVLAPALGLTLAMVAGAQEVKFKDPVGDDKGPGTYTYPTDSVYKAGSFDLTELNVTQKGDKVTFADPATGTIRTTTKQAMNDAPPHPQGNFIFYALKEDGGGPQQVANR